VLYVSELEYDAPTTQRKLGCVSVYPARIVVLEYFGIRSTVRSFILLYSDRKAHNVARFHGSSSCTINHPLSMRKAR
jgi:hypothetical protein